MTTWTGIALFEEEAMEVLIAALVLAVVFADRIGPPAEVRRRFYQVALAFAVFIAVAAIPMLLFPLPKASDIFGPSAGDDLRPAADIVRARATFLTGAGLLLVLAALLRSAQFPTLYLPALLAGSLILIGGLTSPSYRLDLIAAVYQSTGATSSIRDVLYFLVSSAGAACLAIYGYNQWDRPTPSEKDDGGEEYGEEVAAP
jgi:hypothetical protein